MKSIKLRKIVTGRRRFSTIHRPPALVIHLAGLPGRAGNVLSVLLKNVLGRKRLGPGHDC